MALRSAILRAPTHAPDVTDVVDSRSVSVSRDALAGGARDEALDYVKGFLVLVMVLYHWLNYFVGLGWGGYRYIRFLTPSFIFITGFLVSHVYLAKYSYDSPKLRRRLVQRGAKLLLLFGVLNLADTAVDVHSYLISRLAMSWPASRVEAVFISGEGGAAFSILVPIAYFLVLAPAVLAISKRTGVTLASIAGAVLSGAICLSLLGISNSHLELLSIAFVGLAAGAAKFRGIERMADKPALLLLAYLLYVIAITVLNVPFALQVVGVCLSVSLLYVIARIRLQPEAIRRQVIDLGKYSLFAYIAQIAALQLLRRTLRVDELTGGSLAWPLVAALLGTVAAVQSVATLRARWPVADRLYRAVFA